ncbi:MAG: Penicillin-binding protein 4* [Verrucomicrobiota bacterium]|jgi:N-acyl-D-amino-acid deacylase
MARTNACTRRRFLQAGTALAAAAVTGRAAPDPRPPGISPATAFDPVVERFMQERAVPGGALAVVKDGRLVHARGYGRLDRAGAAPVEPGSLFRIASLSKPVTAVAILQLAARGRLDLDAPVFALLALEAKRPPGRNLDPRWQRVTLRHLLQHTGGWDRDRTFDPMFRPRVIAEALGEAPPAGAQAVVRYMLGQPLDFDPGTRYAYSNFGYCLLGRVIETVSGQSYGQFVREQVLAPAGLRTMRLGASRADGRAPGEATYHTATPERTPSVFPGAPGPVDYPYGGFHLEAMDAHGGWIASVLDLARWAAALDTGRPAGLLSPASHREMIAAPAAPVARRPDGSLADHWYGCGWLVRPVGRDGRVNTWHTGSLPGTCTLLVRRADGISYAALFNQRSKTDAELDPLLARAARAVTAWPAHDLFQERHG